MKEKYKEKQIKIKDAFSGRYFDDILAEFIIKKIMKSFTLRKVTAVALLFSFILGATGIGSSPVIGYTLGFYNDTESSSDNEFLAGEVDFILNASNFTPTTTAISLSPGDITMKNIDVDPLDSNPFKYVASTTNVTGDTDFCNALNVNAKLEGLDVYDNGLVGMLTEATTTLDSWVFTIGMGGNNFQNSVCNFDTEYSGSQTRHDYPLGKGFSDVETEENIIASWGFRINKVYYDVAPDRGEEGDNEWVEIYNQTNVPLDINGWEICDNESCDVLSASEDIPAMGYGFITASSTTASTTLPAFWYLPLEVVSIGISDSKIGNGLHNDADMLVLKRPDEVIIDQMNWGTPDEGWTNWDENVWNPGSVDVAEGNSLARVPSGYDTNQPSDFTELVPPSVDLIYPDEAGSYFWSWGSNHLIEWTAFNNNGPDEDLDMRIFYIRDIDGNDVVSDGDIMFNIVETTENDGEYGWTVPSGFIGYIWVYLVGTGPENPMWNSGTISGDIWDPIPVFIGSSDEDVIGELASLDTEPPVITINGNNPALVELGADYSDLGAMVTDNVNPNIGVTTTGEVDTNVLGEYQILYSATDQAGNTAEATRTVIVYDPAIGPPVIETVVPDEPAPEEPTPDPTPTGDSGGGDVVEDNTATTTPEMIVEDNTASTTPEIIVEDTATTTPEVLPEDNTASSTPEVIVEETASSTPETLPEDNTATTTPEVIIEDTATSTPITLPVDETATTTPEVIVEPVILEEPVIVEPVVEEPVEPTPDPEPIVVVEDPALIEDPVVDPPVDEQVTTE